MVKIYTLFALLAPLRGDMWPKTGSRCIQVVSQGVRMGYGCVHWYCVGWFGRCTPREESHGEDGRVKSANAPYSVIYSQIRTYWCVFTDIVGDLVHILAWGTNVGCVIQPP